jgi:hypothetical protein
MGGKRVMGPSPCTSSDVLRMGVANRFPPNLLRLMNESNSVSCEELIAGAEEEFGSRAIVMGRGEKCAVCCGAGICEVEGGSLVGSGR